MNKVSLQFQSLADLVAFQKASNTISYRVIITNMIIIGFFSETTVQLAKRNFNATLLQTNAVLGKVEI